MTEASHPKPLLERIRIETGLVVTSSRDYDVITGILNEYRPLGDGLERLLNTEGVEGAVADRIKRVCAVTAPGWIPGEWYFVVRQPAPIDLFSAVRHAAGYLRGIAQIASFLKYSSTASIVKGLRVTAEPRTDLVPDEDTECMVHECVGDLLADLEPDQNESFYLREAIYSMTNDSVLMAWILWPAIAKATSLPDLLAPYFELWSHGLTLEHAQGSVPVI